MADTWDEEDGLTGSVFGGNTEKVDEAPPPTPHEHSSSMPVILGANIMCIICSVNPRVSGQKWCKLRKRNVDHAYRCAQRENWLDKYEQEKKRDDTLRRLILELRRTCPAQGRGRTRQAFDILEYTRKYYAKTEVARGSLNHMMSYSEWMRYNATNGIKSPDTAHKEWISWEVDPEACGREFDKKGDADSGGIRGYRFEASVADYIDRRNITGTENEVRESTKPKRKYKQEHLDDALDELETGHASFKGRFFADIVGKTDSGFLEHGLYSDTANAKVGPMKAAASSAAEVPESPMPKSGKPFDINIATKPYERETDAFTVATRKKVDACEMALNNLKGLEDVCEDVVLLRFKEILDTRRLLYTNAMDADVNAQEQEAKIDDVFLKLTDKQRSYLRASVRGEFVGHAQVVEDMKARMVQETEEKLKEAVDHCKTQVNRFLKLTHDRATREAHHAGGHHEGQEGEQGAGEIGEGELAQQASTR